MRLSSSPADPGLFDEVLARGPVRVAVGDRAWLRALLDVEAALARAQARLGLIDPADAAAVVAACVVDRYDIASLARESVRSGSPVLPLVHALRSAVGPTSAAAVHKGATTQDIMDTAAMLVAQRSLAPLLADLAGAADAAARLATAHRDTAMAGRTLLQQAVPVTFGLKAASWLIALDEAADRLAEIRRSRLAAQLGGAAGTLAAYDGAGPDLLRTFAAEVGLVTPALPWHTDRIRVAELAGALGAAAGVIGKVARDVTLLAQTEVGEVAEGTPGASSAMPHKRNPIAAVSAYACAAQAPGLVATLLASMVQEHERAAGAWHAEWLPLRELLGAVGSAAAWLRECLAGLVVDGTAIAANLARLVETTGDPVDVGVAPELVDRALAIHAVRDPL